MRAGIVRGFVMWVLVVLDVVRGRCTDFVTMTTLGSCSAKWLFHKALRHFELLLGWVVMVTKKTKFQWSLKMEGFAAINAGGTPAVPGELRYEPASP